MIVCVVLYIFDVPSFDMILDSLKYNTIMLYFNLCSTTHSANTTRHEAESDPTQITTDLSMGSMSNVRIRGAPVLVELCGACIRSALKLLDGRHTPPTVRPSREPVKERRDPIVMCVLGT